MPSRHVISNYYRFSCLELIDEEKFKGSLEKFCLATHCNHMLNWLINRLSSFLKIMKK